MKKRTLQEIADFFGCYVAIDDHLCAILCKTTPHIGVYGCTNSEAWLSNAVCGEFNGNTGIIADAEEHDWRVLIEPHTREAAK